MQLQRNVGELEKQGLGLVAISYDSVETLKRFAAARGITFPLVSDAGSATIKKYGLLNTTIDASTRSYGVPWPGTFIVDRKGVVEARYFEQAYQERSSVASMLVRQGVMPFGSVSTIETPHLSLMAGVSDARVEPGRRISLVFEVQPKPGMHVYAPGKHSYQTVGATIDPQPWLRVQRMRYPASEIYHFEPLDERVEVYMKPFRLVQDVTVLATKEAEQQLASRSSLTITGRFEYQACDDKLCYTPQAVPVSWTIDVGQLERK